MQDELDYRAEKLNFSAWKRLYAYALRWKKTLLLVIIGLLMVSSADAVYPLLTRYAIDHFMTPGTTEGLTGFALSYGLTIFISGLSTFLFISNSGKIEAMIAYTIRQEAFERLQTLSFSFYDKTPVGYLMARTVSDVARLSEMVAWSIVDVLYGFMYLLIILWTMLSLNQRLTLVVILVIPPLAVVSAVLRKKILDLQRQARKQNSRITGALNEGIMGMHTTKTLVLEDQNERMFNGLSEEYRRVSVKAARMNACFFPLITSLGAVGTGFALMLGGNGVLFGELSWAGTVSIGTLVSFISYATGLFDPILQIATTFAELQDAQASAERVLDLLDTEPEVRDTEESVRKYGDTFKPQRENWEPIMGNVQFDHVDFYYKPEEVILKDFCLDVRAGENIALVGETGAGKSTIVNLLCRFYEPRAGRILIDGRDYRERSQLWLQSSLGYVLQQPHLFSGSVADNIRFGRPDASDEEVRAAAAMVHADAFIEKLDKGYDTDVGEDGARLSTGQKQLISFARVILADPAIFVLDEATSSIDTETEALIQKAITKVLSGRTSFIVAHRLSTVRSADRILVIRDGGIAECGSHGELMERKGIYYGLYNRQYREEAVQSALSGRGSAAAGRGAAG